MTVYDVIIVGGGPGGYVAAVRAAKLGKKVALVEADLLGGACLNKGCIPSKTLLNYAEVIEQVDIARSWGINSGSLMLDYKRMLERKDEIVQTLRNGVESLLHNNKVDIYNGIAEVTSGHQVVVDEDTELKGEKIIIASGSRPSIPPVNGLEQIDYHTTDSIFEMNYIPDSIVIVGGGVIGTEIADMFSSFGTKVTIIELNERIIPTEDESASNHLLKALRKKGVKILLKHQVNEVSQDTSNKKLVISDDSGKTITLTADELLIATGRSPNTDLIKQLELDMNGHFIKTNEYLETSIKGIFAIGDVIGNYQLAHVASSEALTAVANLDKPQIKANYSVIPRCIYTSPQVATVGMIEGELRKRNIKYRVYTFNFDRNGMALVTGKTEGFSKIMIDEKYGEILGVVMVGDHATEIISQSSSYMYLEGTIDELAKMIQPHPSLSEVLMESANSLIGKGIHSN
ncbi:dihydrolipoyl dehydrogenase [Lacicoccus alkaliphilus]|uniref:Dihydrolipoyl dehydrogenase n=1 Tax=Lacicoccus alkaliphilus DSM 16010 TaxID=1123231 RepID=A0A1M7CZA0_9BACL|nr:dihydrolipoyl dehydrogenase [Salinicoccus alkaliphilus]SHL72453.1 dihydrolipoamide dehydrogenase [Salinicoccus alkaliphilus DSM 16010]